MNELFVNFGQTFAFALITLVVIASGLTATYARSIVHSAFALFFTLLGMAGYYFLLGADFLGIVQVIVYVGGILVLLLFGVLLTSRSVDQLLMRPRQKYLLATTFGLILILFLSVIATKGSFLSVPPTIPDESVRAIGRLLLTDYVLAFEFSSITLLAALIGASYLVRRREK